ncbi:MAG: hypothetical protein J6T10_21210 [Methanobrevibacter sp.]|nr:hypothetical protein [Methanobrevibacter sp.]
MANETINQYIIKQLQADGSLLILHPETDAAIVLVKKGENDYPGDAANVQAALEELFAMVQQSGVTGVKGNNESNYRQGNVNLTPGNIGAVAANEAISGATHTKIKYDSKGLVIEGSDATLDDIADGSTRKLSDYAPKSTAVTYVAYDTVNKKLTKTINGSTTDVVSVATLKVDLGLDNVTNNAQIKGLGTGTTQGHFVVWGADGYTVADGGATTQFATAAQGEKADSALQEADFSFGSYDANKHSVATLGSDGKVPEAQLPSYVDDVIESYIVTGATPLSEGWLSKTPSGSAFVPELGKIYVVLTPESEYTNKTYRWGGTTYVVISDSLVIGTTAGTAYDGASGQANADAITALEGKFSGNMAKDSDKLDGHHASYFAIATDLSAISAYFDSNGVAKKATADALGNTISSTYQPQILSTPITVDGTAYTNLIDIITALNTLATAANSLAGLAQPKILSTAITVDGTSKTTVEEALAAINTLAATNKTNIGTNTTNIATNADDISTLKGYFTNNGVALKAVKLNTARSISATGDISWTVTFDGSGDVIGTATLADSGVTPGTYSAVAVDAKGRVTAGGQIIEIGVKSDDPITNQPSDSLAVGGLFFEQI